MDQNNPTKFLHYDLKDSQVLDVIIHGGSKGIESQFIKKLFEASKDQNHSAIAFNFPYFERGEENSSRPELTEELETLLYFLNLAEANRFSHVRLIGKSLGGIVASRFLNNLPQTDQSKYELIIMGYVLGDIKLSNFHGKITVIQGEKDKYGAPKSVKKDLEVLNSKDIYFREIKHADHSYRDDVTKEPTYEDEAINYLR